MQKTYSRKGQRPKLVVRVVSQKHLKAAVAISPQGDLYYEVRECSFKSQAIVRFLKNLQRIWRKKILVIWDGASIHTSQPVKDWLGTQHDNNPRTWLARIPPYSPELNPAELVWSYMKNTLLGNICCKTVNELKIKVIEAFEAIKQDRELIQSFFLP